ncbi:MAG TPA: hypothetical protein VK104_07635 [Burkholderiaceae bacterium]|nr:hypothetical protein [Burkholderiaceae bacterium]
MPEPMPNAEGYFDPYGGHILVNLSEGDKDIDYMARHMGLPG